MPLPVAHRLPLRKERDRLQKEGRTFYTRHFTLVTAPTPSPVTSPVGAQRGAPENTPVIPDQIGNPSPVPRFSILLSKKTARLAVNRNLIKRRTSALLAELLPQPASPKAGFPAADYLVIPKRSVLATPYSDLLANLSSLLPKLK